MRPRKLRASEEIRALIRRMHPGLKKKVGAAMELVAIGPRRTIYEETLRLLRRDAPEERGRG